MLRNQVASSVLGMKLPQTRDGWLIRHTFTEEPKYPIDFAVGNHFVATHPNSPFRARLFGVIDLLRSKKLLVTHGRGFNWPEPDHFRLVTLPDEAVLTEAIGRIGEYLATLRA